MREFSICAGSDCQRTPASVLRLPDTSADNFKSIPARAIMLERGKDCLHKGKEKKKHNTIMALNQKQPRSTRSTRSTHAHTTLRHEVNSLEYCFTDVYVLQLPLQLSCFGVVSRRMSLSVCASTDIAVTTLHQPHTHLSLPKQNSSRTGKTTHTKTRWECVLVGLQRCVSVSTGGFCLCFDAKALTRRLGGAFVWSLGASVGGLRNADLRLRFLVFRPC